MQTFNKTERHNYRFDTKTLLMRNDLTNKDTATLNNAILIENTFFVLSRIYVPLRLVVMYRKGVFSENISFNEINKLFNIMVACYAI